VRRDLCNEAKFLRALSERGSGINRHCSFCGGFSETQVADLLRENANAEITPRALRSNGRGAYHPGKRSFRVLYLVGQETGKIVKRGLIVELFGDLFNLLDIVRTEIERLGFPYRDRAV
jgi:hypothetical protein